MLKIIVLAVLSVFCFFRIRREVVIKQYFLPYSMSMNQFVSILHEVVEKMDGSFYVYVSPSCVDEKVNISICKGKEGRQGFFRHYVKFSKENGMFCFSLDEDCSSVILNSRRAYFKKGILRRQEYLDEIISILSNSEQMKQTYMQLLKQNEQEMGAWFSIIRPLFFK